MPVRGGEKREIRKGAVNLVLFIGLPATGKSTFYRERFSGTHVRLNLDMLRTRHRERLLFLACLEGKTKVVVDNTNLTRAFRQSYLAEAAQAGFLIEGYFFESRVQDALRRNESRSDPERVPEAAIRGGAGSLELPSLKEGFARLYFVRLAEDGGFQVEDWKNEI